MALSGGERFAFHLKSHWICRFRTELLEKLRQAGINCWDFLNSGSSGPWSRRAPGRPAATARPDGLVRFEEGRSNFSIRQIKRVAFDFTNFENSRMRSLLYAVGIDWPLLDRMIPRGSAKSRNYFSRAAPPTHQLLR